MPEPHLKLNGAHAVIFGGAGFIGQHLSKALLDGGAASVISGDIRTPAGPAPDGVRYEHVDVRRPIDLEHRGPAPLVFNLAAVHRTPGHTDDEYYETNVAGAEHVVGFCEAHEVTSLWFTSSIAVYGSSEEPRSERSPLRASSAYGKSKALAEEIHRSWVGKGDRRRLVTVRPAAVFGPGEAGNFTRLARALGRRRFVYPGRKNAIKSCGYVAELIRTMIYMRSYADPEITYNFTYPDPPSTEEICRALHEIAGLPKPLGVVPVRPLMILARGLASVGFRSFDPARVKKLVMSTNIEPAELIRCGYPYETDLRSGIAAWRDAPPAGEFV